MQTLRLWTDPKMNVTGTLGCLWYRMSLYVYVVYEVVILKRSVITATPPEIWLRLSLRYDFWRSMSDIGCSLFLCDTWDLRKNRIVWFSVCVCVTWGSTVDDCPASRCRELTWGTLMGTAVRVPSICDGGEMCCDQTFCRLLKTTCMLRGVLVLKVDRKWRTIVNIFFYFVLKKPSWVLYHNSFRTPSTASESHSLHLCSICLSCASREAEGPGQC